MKRSAGTVLRGLAPIIDERSRILILGTMPGPVALARRQYYGFPGNHFWKVLPAVLGEPAVEAYPARLELLRRHHIALWDVLKTCRREGALDAEIRDGVPNDLPALIAAHPAIGAVFLNGRLAERLYRRWFGGHLHLPVRTLPSTSPAHASQSLDRKIDAWRAILPALTPYRPWC
ncbi:MAG: hypothetical protein MOGMAGMI_00521 [Candidatus Omnitrophica bacterium]|nr:hypothetical protein [Candidatus Omnitrophota bacterium]